MCLFVCFFKKKNRNPLAGADWCHLRRELYLRKQSVSVVDPDRWLSPFTVLPSPPGLRGQKGVDEPGRSRLMSQNGSIVVETPLELKKR